MSNQRINLFYKVLDCFFSIFHVFASINNNTNNNNNNNGIYIALINRCSKRFTM